jgi:hypothetical protein
VPVGFLGRVQVTIYDVAGRRVRSLVDELLGPGRRVVRWDLSGQGGRKVSAGLYFLRMEAEGFAKTRKIVVVR